MCDLWDVITYPCPRYLPPVWRSSYIIRQVNKEASLAGGQIPWKIAARGKMLTHLPLDKMAAILTDAIFKHIFF